MKKNIVIILIIFIFFTNIFPMAGSIKMNQMLPDLVYSPTSHDFGYVEEGEIYQTTFEIWNGGTDILTWNLGIVHTWISPFPTSGSSTGEHDIITVTINTTGLSNGINTGFVSISANDGGGLRYFNIELYINNPPSAPIKPSGPSSGFVEEKLYYNSSSSDPDGDYIKFGLDYNDDGVVDGWGNNYHPSGSKYTFTITAHSPGIFNIRLIAKDEHGAESGWSNPKTVTITINNKPLRPLLPSGPTSGNIDSMYSFTTSTTDQDDDKIKFGWDWNGNGNIDEWSSYYNSSDICTMLHSWSSAGVYEIKVRAQDEHGLNSDWSLSLNITITDNAPLKPEITGPTSGKAGNSYTYFVSTIDPDDDQIYYWINWDDGTNTGWLGPYNSGLSVSSSHIWSSEGTYSIKVKSKDSNGLESQWSDPLSISMPKLKQYNIKNYPIIEFIENNKILKIIFKMIRL
jgi:hypothetical protein